MTQVAAVAYRVRPLRSEHLQEIATSVDELAVLLLLPFGLANRFFPSGVLQREAGPSGRGEIQSTLGATVVVCVVPKGMLSLAAVGQILDGSVVFMPVSGSVEKILGGSEFVHQGSDRHLLRSSARGPVLWIAIVIDE